MPEIKGIQVPFLPAGGISELNRKPSLPVSAGKGPAFGEILQDELLRLKFSGHAQSRMVSRDISLNENEMQTLEEAVRKAGEKGSQDTLVLFQDKGFIVNVPNRTVITAVRREQMDDSVVTNIDSAVLV